MIELVGGKGARCELFAGLDSVVDGRASPVIHTVRDLFCSGCSDLFMAVLEFVIDDRRELAPVGRRV